MTPARLLCPVVVDGYSIRRGSVVLVDGGSMLFNGRSIPLAADQWEPNTITAAAVDDGRTTAREEEYQEAKP